MDYHGLGFGLVYGLLLWSGIWSMVMIKDNKVLGSVLLEESG